MLSRTKKISYLVSLFLGISSAFASSSQVFQMSVGGITYTCGSVSGVWRSGKLKSGNFSSYRQLVARYRLAARSATGTRKKTLLSKVKSNRARASTGDPLCSDGPPGGGSTPTPTPAPGNFDFSGNLTEKGKTTFGVPSSLSGNLSVGRTVYNSYCAGCHSSEKVNWTYSSLRAAISGDPMYFTSNDITDAQLANLVAFLNRFRL